MRRIDWPPKSEKPIKERGRQASREGEPMWVPLKRWPYDQTLRGQMSNGCCDCGLVHHLTFEVVRQKDGQWWLIKRAYRTGKLGKRLT